MLSTYLAHLGGVGVEEGPTDESLQSSAGQPSNLSGYNRPTLGVPSHSDQLERCQKAALRAVTGQLKFTPVETQRREAGIYSIATAS